jgi:hypothetical protein
VAQTVGELARTLSQEKETLRTIEAECRLGPDDPGVRSADRGVDILARCAAGGVQHDPQSSSSSQRLGASPFWPGRALTTGLPGPVCSCFHRSGLA